MNDLAESMRRQRLAEINVNPACRETLEAMVGRVWDTQQLSLEFEVIGFMAPFVVVRCKSDAMKGSLEFQHDPRFYFSWKPHDESI